MTILLIFENKILGTFKKLLHMNLVFPRIHYANLSNLKCIHTANMIKCLNTADVTKCIHTADIKKILQRCKEWLIRYSHILMDYKNTLRKFWKKLSSLRILRASKGKNTQYLEIKNIMINRNNLKCSAVPMAKEDTEIFGHRFWTECVQLLT